MTVNDNRKVCEDCGQSFDSDQKLQEHRRTAHSLNKRSPERPDQGEKQKEVA